MTINKFILTALQSLNGAQSSGKAEHSLKLHAFKGLASLDTDEENLQEAAADFVDDVIFHAKEMIAQRSAYQVQQAFSIVEEEDEEAVLAEEMANRLPPESRENSFSGPTPEIQIDLVGDRTPSPEETPIYVAPPPKIRQVKIRHKQSTSSPEDSDESKEDQGHTDIDKRVDQNNVRNNVESNFRSDTTNPCNHYEDKMQQQNSKTEQNYSRQINSSVKADGTDNNSIHQVSPTSGSQRQHPLDRSQMPPDNDSADKTDILDTQGSKQISGCMMFSKPVTLQFADESPQEAESPSEAQVAERLATTKCPLPNEAKDKNLSYDPDLRHFVEEYLKGITEQAQLLADERVRKSIPHAKYHSPTDGPRASVVLTTKSPEGPWYSRLRSALTECLQSSCFCVKFGRQPEAV